jgi:hypothetical protein
MTATIGAFEVCAVPWAVTDDEILFIGEGVLTRRGWGGPGASGSIRTRDFESQMG